VRFFWSILNFSESRQGFVEGPLSERQSKTMQQAQKQGTVTSEQSQVLMKNMVRVIHGLFSS
jgi:hypothetical protein